MKAILTAGLAGGLVDLVYAGGAAAVAGRDPLRVPFSIASFWLGKAAGDGGPAPWLLGLATHFGLATVMAGGYALAAQRFPVLLRRPLIFAPLYGLVLYAVMYRLVLPLRWPELYPRWDGLRSITDILAHLGVALAIALVLARRRTPATP